MKRELAKAAKKLKENPDALIDPMLLIQLEARKIKKNLKKEAKRLKKSKPSFSRFDLV